MWELGQSHWVGVGEVGGTGWVVLGLSCQLWGRQKAEVLPLATRGAPSTVFIIKHHHGVHMPDLCGRGVGVQPARGQGNPSSLLAFNIKDLGRKAMVPVAQFGKTWAVTFRFKPFPVAQRQRQKERER